MMQKHLLIAKITLFAVVLPFIYGCQGGGSSGSASLLGGGGASSLAGGGGPGDPGGAGGPIGGGLETIHQPEPASLLLLGSGMAAMAFWKNRTQK